MAAALMSPSIDVLLRRRLELEQAAPSADIAVPCGSCTACCRRTGPISVAEDEAAPELQLVTDAAGIHWLPRNPDGACRHITDAGCAVYQQRPRACRRFDCRIPAAFGVQGPAAPGHPFPVWRHAAPSPVDAVLNDLARLIGVLVVAEQDGQPCSVGGLLPVLIGHYLTARDAAMLDYCRGHGANAGGDGDGAGGDGGEIMVPGSVPGG
jgi:hypothetical protein